MTVHLSIRLPWHDRGWDGHVCDRPDLNPYCGGLHSVNAERIRGRDLKAEMKAHGCHIGSLPKGVVPPPCTETINVFGSSQVDHVHTPPDFIRGAQPVSETYAAGASGTWPFEEMWTDKGKPRPPAERKTHAGEHFSAVTPRESLSFYYCNYDNPITGDSNRYLLVGIARIKATARDSKQWPNAQPSSVERYGGFVWSRCVANGWPKEGIRLPYQEMLNDGMTPEEIAKTAVFIDNDLSARFKYVTRHVDDDDATILIEQTMGFLRRHLKAGRLPGPNATWERTLKWLDSILAECWANRGPFPGLAAVLNFLDFPESAEFVKADLLDLVPKAEKRRDWVFGRLAGKTTVPANLKKRFAPAIERWHSLSADAQSLLRDKMVLFALDETQVERSIGPKRTQWGIEATDAQLANNPYILCEDYFGDDSSDRIGFSRIDHGLRPPPELAKISGSERIERTDGRRLRALIIKALEEQATAGHTFIDRDELAALLEDTDDDPADLGAIMLDEARWRQYRTIFADKLVTDPVDGVDAVSLKTLSNDESRIRGDVVKLVRDKLSAPSKIKWENLLRQVSKDNNERPIDAAISGQAKALETLWRARFSILSGGAGTGKTTVMRAFVQGIQHQSKGHSILLLAPTGKASVLLSERVGLPAGTLHRFLKSQEWITGSNYRIRRKGGKRSASHRTVIVDEASMVDVTLLSTLLRALNLEYVDRLILVGDPGQLPPIGPGRPFLDIIDHLRRDKERASTHLAVLDYNCRQAQGSEIATLAGHFARVEERPDEDVLDLVLNGGSKGDLTVRLFAAEADLPDALKQTFEQEVKALSGLSQDASIVEAYKRTYKLDDFQNVNLDALQIIAPYRIVVDQINDIVRRQLWGEQGPQRPLHGFAVHDRVMQTTNRDLWAYDFSTKTNDLQYVPNGQLGFVTPVTRENFERFKNVPIRFGPNYYRFKFDMSESRCSDNLAFSYGLSAHKSQGSQFNTVIAVVPARDTPFLSRELLYTLLTRAKGRLVLLLEKDAGTTLSRTWGGHSELLRRNSAMFRTARGFRGKALDRFRTDELVTQALPELFVRSAGEALIARTLTALEIGFFYEKPLSAADAGPSKRPDFTFRLDRQDWYLEHLGMRGSPEYDKDWARKEKWYKQNGYQGQLLTTPLEGKSLEHSLEDILCGRFGLDRDLVRNAICGR